MRNETYPMVATAATFAVAFAGSSAAADMPTGKPSDAPTPHRTVPAIANGAVGPMITSSRPANARKAEPARTGTRPNRSRNAPPNIRPAVIAVTNTAKTAAPPGLLSP
jgi:hypothetical protein